MTVSWCGRRTIYRLALAAGVVLVAGCATKSPAPVVDRTVPSAKPAQAAAAAGTGFHTVKKGETLYSIALEHGQDYKDVAAWNNLDNPNVIKVGQQLRVAPPDGAVSVGVAVATPIVGPAVVEARPLGEGPAVGQNTESVKREPKGGTLAYSEQALARAQKSDEGAPKEAGPVALAKPEAKPEPKAAEPAAGTDEAVDWSWPYAGKLLTGFSEGANKGIDLGGKLGDPVLAAAGGKVLYVGNNVRGYGNLVIIKHNSLYLSAYAHNNKILVKENQNVSKGQKIAELGASDTDQPRLHFEIRRQGKPVDPMKYLPVR